MQQVKPERLAKTEAPDPVSETVDAARQSSVQVSPQSNLQTHSQTKGFGVAASPFNGIKLELAICFILGALLWLGADSIIADAGAQLLILLGYSVLAAVWLMLRTRTILRRCKAEVPGEVEVPGNETQQ